MRHKNKINKLNMDSAHRKAVIKNLLISLLRHERIKTTKAKAKVLRSYAEKIITKAVRSKKDGIKPEEILHLKREVFKVIKRRKLVRKLFEDIAERYIDRPGGYTRIIHLPQKRRGDNAQRVMIELVEEKHDFEKKEKKKKNSRYEEILSKLKGGDTQGQANDTETKKEEATEEKADVKEPLAEAEGEKTEYR